MAAATPASTASAGPSTGMYWGGGGARRRPRRGARPGQQLGHHEPAEEGRGPGAEPAPPRGDGHPAAARRAKASTVAASTGSSSVPASRARAQPGTTWLTAST